MTLNEYQKLASRTMNPDLSDDLQTKHALYGMCSELGELQGLHQKVYQGHGFDARHAMKELGDLLWFVAEYATAHGWSLDDVAEQNIAKLQARYPEGFEEGRSLNRVEGDI